MLNSRVRLITFNGSVEGPSDCHPEENYWLLIGQIGKVISLPNDRSRVLVEFELPVESLGIHCHNPIKNSLFILESDLQMV